MYAGVARPGRMGRRGSAALRASATGSQADSECPLPRTRMASGLRTAGRVSPSDACVNSLGSVGL